MIPNIPAPVPGPGRPRVEQILEIELGDGRRSLLAVVVNEGRAMALTADITLPPPFRPSAAVLGRRIFTMRPGERLHVELGTTTAATSCAAAVRAALRLHCA